MNTVRTSIKGKYKKVSKEVTELKNTITEKYTKGAQQ